MEGACICQDECNGDLTCLPGTYGDWDPGGGPWTGAVRTWFHTLSDAPSNKPHNRIRTEWTDVLEQWWLIELDFQDWGLDLEPLLPVRTWRWFKLRLLCIMGNPQSRTHKALSKEAPNDPPSGPGQD